MELTLKITLTILLLIIAIQDFKHRAVWWLLFPIAVVVQLSIAYIYFSSWEFLFFSILNLAIIAIQLVVLYAYLLFKLRKTETKKTKLIRKYLGLGDILFFVILATAFSTLNFIIVLLLLLTLSLIVAVFTFKKNGTIPLAGIMALGYTFLLWISYIVPSINPYIEIINIYP